MKTDLELLKEYLQSEIDCGNHKLFIFDENNYATELKTIDGFNAITDLEQEIERLKNELAKIPKAKMEYDLEIERLNNIIYREISDYILKKYGMLDDTHYHDFLNELELKESGNNE